MADSREVMNIRQASQYLGVSPDTLYKYVGEQKIPAFKLGNRWRFKKSRLDQWMEEKSSQMEAKGKKKPKAKTVIKDAASVNIKGLKKSKKYSFTYKYRTKDTPAVDSAPSASATITVKIKKKKTAKR